MSPVVSFYTTVLRPDEKLRRTHQSLQQEGVPWEHVVTVARDFEHVFDFLPKGADNVTALSTPGAGISEGFNAAIRQCRGKFLMAANAGDLVLDARRLVAALERDPGLQVVYGDIRREGRIVKACPGPLTRWDWITHAMCFCHGAAMTRSDFHQRYGFYDPQYRLTMDTALYLSAVYAEARMTYVPQVVAEIERDGVSSHPLNRTRENYRAIRQRSPWGIAFPIACKWLLVAGVAKSCRLPISVLRRLMHPKPPQGLFDYGSEGSHKRFQR
jgi:hypothetical protein